MERHKCRLCFKKFGSGRALGGHMRSHMMNPPTNTTRLKPPPQEDTTEMVITAATESETSSSSPSSSEDETEYEEERRDPNPNPNPNPLTRSVDAQFTRLAAEAAGSSSNNIIQLQDRESETESSKKPTKRRSKRNRKSFLLHLHKINTSTIQPCYDHYNYKKKGHEFENSINEGGEQQPAVSSISEVSPEEDVALCLMMLSRDKWNLEKQKKKMKKIGGDNDDDNIHVDFQVKLSESTEQVLSDQEEEELIAFTKLKDIKKNINGNNRGGGSGKYKCETCDKVFRSYQALGGHRASHKKFKVTGGTSSLNKKHPCDDDDNNNGEFMKKKKKIHECPICLRVFVSGQALGGHKRSHVIGIISSTSIDHEHDERRRKEEESKVQEDEEEEIVISGGNWIDLNLPPPGPVDDYEISQNIAVSALSDNVNL